MIESMPRLIGCPGVISGALLKKMSGVIGQAGVLRLGFSDCPCRVVFVCGCPHGWGALLLAFCSL